MGQAPARSPPRGADTGRGGLAPPARRGRPDRLGLLAGLLVTEPAEALDHLLPVGRRHDANRATLLRGDQAADGRRARHARPPDRSGGRLRGRSRRRRRVARTEGRRGPRSRARRGRRSRLPIDRGAVDGRTRRATGVRGSARRASACFRRLCRARARSARRSNQGEVHASQSPVEASATRRGAHRLPRPARPFPRARPRPRPRPGGAGRTAPTSRGPGRCAARAAVAIGPTSPGDPRRPRRGAAGAPAGSTAMLPRGGEQAGGVARGIGVPAHLGGRTRRAVATAGRAKRESPSMVPRGWVPRLQPADHPRARRSKPGQWSWDGAKGAVSRGGAGR